MRVLVACEFSGIVREAFRKRGHDAWSCDLLPTEIPGNHIQDNVLAHISDGWDMMIAHPPCTHLSVAGARFFEAKRKDGRQQEAIEFFMTLADANIHKIAIENPVCIMSSVWRKPDQCIQPWQFGEPDTKKTCLWLKNLPPLMDTLIVNPEYVIYKSKKNKCGFSRYSKNWGPMGPSNHRGHDRSKTYQGIADAMADQWG